MYNATVAAETHLRPTKIIPSAIHCWRPHDFSLGHFDTVLLCDRLTETDISMIASTSLHIAGYHIAGYTGML